MGKYALIFACLTLTACEVSGYEAPEKSPDAGIDSGSVHVDSGSVDANPDSQPDSGADVATQDSTDSAPAVPDSAQDSGIDTGDVDSETDSTIPDAGADAASNDPCDIPPLGQTGGAWNCYGQCPNLHNCGPDESACSPNLSDAAEASLYPPQTGGRNGYIILRHGFYRFRVEQGGCAKFTAIGGWKFVIDDESHVVDYATATPCLVVSGWGHPEGHTGVLVQARNTVQGISRIDFQSVKMEFGGTCSLSCP